MPGASQKLLHRALFFDRVLGAGELALSPGFGLVLNRMRNRIREAERAGACMQAVLRMAFSGWSSNGPRTRSASRPGAGTRPAGLNPAQGSGRLTSGNIQVH